MARRQKSKKQKDHPSELVHSDGALAITFVNTGSRRSPALRDYEALLEWAAEHGAIHIDGVAGLRQRVAEDPLRAEVVFAVAADLHRLLARVFDGLARREAPSSATLDSLNDLLVRATPRRALVAGPDCLDWGWRGDGEELFRPLWAVVRSLTDLLTSADYGKIKRCAAENCDVLFLANRSGMPRKWCDPACGMPIRSRKHYELVTRPRRRKFDREWKRGEKS